MSWSATKVTNKQNSYKLLNIPTGNSAIPWNFCREFSTYRFPGISGVLDYRGGLCFCGKSSAEINYLRQGDSIIPFVCLPVCSSVYLLELYVEMWSTCSKFSHSSKRLPAQNSWPISELVFIWFSHVIWSRGWRGGWGPPERGLVIRANPLTGFANNVFFFFPCPEQY